MRYVATASMIMALSLAVMGVRGETSSREFSPYVDAEGSIRLPEDYRQWAFLGSWYIAADKEMDDSAGAAGFHNVYTQRSALQAYLETGEFPDGTVLVKELLKGKSGELTTGEVSWATDIEGWFIMVKDRVGRFPDNPLWGEGWGWVLLYAEDPGHTVTKNWRVDCLGCHYPARSTDLVFTQGYPVLEPDRNRE